MEMSAYDSEHNNMDIESQYRKRMILKTVGGDYDLEWCRWRVMGSQTKKKREIFNPNTKGYIHAALTLKNTVYAFFGPDETRPNASMHSYNFKSNEWKEWKDCSLPESRDSFGLAVHQNEIYMFGGSSYDTQFGDLNAFNTLSCEWRALSPANSPAPRNPLVFADIANEFIFLYGGINLETAEIFNDAYVFAKQEWTHIEKIVNAPNNLVGAKFAVCQSKAFIFGGEFQDEYGLIQPNRKLYKLMINVAESSVEFVAVGNNDVQCPCPRTSHSMVGVGNELIILVGGQSILKNKMLRDIWLFNIQSSEWTKIDPVNGPVRPLSQNSLVVHSNNIFIFGGLTEHQNMWNEQILALQFGESEPYRNEICTNCIQRSIHKEKEDKSFPKTVVLSSGFFYTISLQIKHPFQAIQILYDCAAYLRATDFKISAQRSLNENQHIEIEFDGSTLNKQQFEDLLCHSSTNNEELSRFITNLKVACLRLGKTLIFVTADSFQRKVFMFSADSKITPSFDQSYGFFGYVENIRKGSVESHQGKSHKELILNVLRSRIATPEQALNVSNCNKILIFEKNILVTSDKVYYYELISTANDDITIYKSAKKLQFLEELGYEISKEPEVSLKNYLSIARLNFTGHPSICIHRKEGAVHPYDYLSVLRKLEREGKITAFEMPSKMHDIELECTLFIADSDKVIQHNLGLLIYQDDRLVNRMPDYFGELFKEQFYKTKFKKAATIFEFLGVINVKKGLTLNYFGSWFKKNRNYYLFLENFRTATRKAKQDKTDRLKADDGNDDSKGRRLRA